MFNGYLHAGQTANNWRCWLYNKGVLGNNVPNIRHFNLPSRSTTTSASANAVRSDFADSVADASAAAVECKEFKYASKSDTDAADSSLPLESVSASALALPLEVL